jgi:lysophospholipid acyltransferase
MPWVNFFWLMGTMSVSHIIRQRLNDPSVVDITGGQMVMVIKLGAFAWNVHDGRLKPELMTDAQKDRAIYKLPNLLDYAGYVFFFPSVWTGPAFDFVDYKRWLETSLFEVPAGTKPAPTHGTRRIPRSGRPATIKLLTGLVWVILFLQFSTWYNAPFVLSDEYTTYTLPRRIWILYMLGLTSRMKYYGVWTITEGACILSGLGYNGIDPQTHQPKWDRLENVNAWGIETAQNSRAYLDNWNKNTNKWLRNYVYLRVTPKGKKPGFRATLATFMTSAFWHGFYPGYYLTFLMGAFLQTVAKNFRRYVRPFFLTPDGQNPTRYKPIYDGVCWFMTQFAFCFTTAPFVVLGFGDSIQVWSRVYFYGIVGVAVSMAFFASPAKPYLAKTLDRRNHPYIRKTVAQETNYLPSLGLPSDPGREIDEAIDEIRQEVEMRRRRGSKVTMPSGEGLKKAIEEKIGARVLDLRSIGGGFAIDEKAQGRERARENEGAGAGVTANPSEKKLR